MDGMTREPMAVVRLPGLFARFNGPDGAFFYRVDAHVDGHWTGHYRGGPLGEREIFASEERALERVAAVVASYLLTH